MEKQILLRLETINKEQLKLIALKENRSVNSLINVAIDRHLKQTPEVMYKLGYVTALNSLLDFFEFANKKLGPIEVEDFRDLINKLKDNVKHIKK